MAVLNVNGGSLADETEPDAALLWVLEGKAVRSQPVGAEGRSCAGCHSDARRSMRGVAER